MGADEISYRFRAKLEKDLNNLQSIVSQTADYYNQCLNQYGQKVQESLNQIEYFSTGDFLHLHQNAKNAAISEVCILVIFWLQKSIVTVSQNPQFSQQFQSQPGDDEFKFNFQPKIESKIEQKCNSFAEQNRTKRQNFRVGFRELFRFPLWCKRRFFIENGYFQAKVDAFSEVLSREIQATFENKVRTVIGSSYLHDDSFIGLFMTAKQTALEEVRQTRQSNSSFVELSNNNTFCLYSFAVFVEKNERGWNLEPSLSYVPWETRTQFGQCAIGTEAIEWTQ